MYQVGLHGKIGGQDIHTANTCVPLAEALSREVSAVESSIKIAPYFGECVIKYEDQAFSEEKVFYSDSNFFDFFTFHVIDGDPASALVEPNSLVLTKSLATKYFGSENALGKLLSVGNSKNLYKVTAITEDCPSNSHFNYTIILSSSSVEYLRSTEWLGNFLYTYFILRDGAQLQEVQTKLRDFVVKNVGPEIERFMGVSIEKMEEQGGAYGYYTTPIVDIHLRSISQDFLEPPGNITYVYFFSGIGLFIILIACINFMNLATARSSGRAKEVGLRKTLGSMRRQLINQFIIESMMYSVITVVASVILCYLLLPQFNVLSGKTLEFALFQSKELIIGLILLVILIGLMAGSYPAFYLTSFNPVEVLKGKLRSGMKSKGVRSTLVVFQFALSIFLIIFTTMVYQQVSFMQERNIGFDKHNIIRLNNAYRLGNDMDAFKNAVDEQTGIIGSSYSNGNFPGGGNNTTVFKIASSEQDHIMTIYQADYEHKDVLKLQIKEGRFFSRDFPSDSSAILINEAAAREFGFTDNAVGETLINNDNGRVELNIIGVYNDFNFESLRNKVRPLAIRLNKRSANLLIRYEGSAPAVLKTIETLWKKHTSNEPFDYKFVDQEYDELFRSDLRMGQVFTLFSALAIFIACLGLFALAAFTTEQRTKEIGIRKALGASTTGLSFSLSKEFTILVIIAFIPAAIIGWFVVDLWLNSFAYRVELSPVIFIASGVLSILVAWLTVSYQAIKAATSNPVESLRYE
jgi:putative ABC transport system permease protein